MPKSPMSDPPRPTAKDALNVLLARSGREHAPLRPSFVQGGTLRKPEAGPLAGLVSAHDERGLDSYLLVVAVASADPFTVTEYAAAWARALDYSVSKDALTAVSKTWRRLADRNLITRERKGRRACIGLLKEDGSGDVYTAPGAQREIYFKLPFAYWHDEWHRKLTFAGKVMLLVALERPDGFPLPAERAPAWYGISRETAQKGLQELETKGLLDVDADWRLEPLSQIGYTEERLYTLKPPFGPKKRKHNAAKRRAAAKKAVKSK